jgi:A/G-specific adenine glycosylase
VSRFASALVAWQKRHGRHGLPWQDARDPYRVWLSEIMLQQTQVAAVIPYYRRFLEKYPDVRALAAASEDEVLRLWSGLGYYARGRNLHAAAKIISARGFPRTSTAIQDLPGVGRSTAAAIAAFAFGRREAILDGNVKRVLARRFGISGSRELWAKAEELLPETSIAIYTQALMDLGATVCVRRNPRCAACPVRKDCVARTENRIAELPPPRKKKILPLRKATWYVFRRNGQVLLERRPGRGLWGGLWTFPEAPLTRAGKPRPLPVFEHGFTHFRLRVRPVLFELKNSRTGDDAKGRLWIDVETARAAAVPAPVRTLLACLPEAL